MDEIQLILKAKYGNYWEEALLNFLTHRSFTKEGFHQKMVEASFKGTQKKYEIACEKQLNAETAAIAVGSICKYRSIQLKKNENYRKIAHKHMKDFGCYKMDEFCKRFEEKEEEIS